MSALSSSTPAVPVGSKNAVVYRPGKFHDAPLLPVDRNTTNELD